MTARKGKRPRWPTPGLERAIRNLVAEAEQELGQAMFDLGEEVERIIGHYGDDYLGAYDAIRKVFREVKE